MAENRKFGRDALVSEAMKILQNTKEKVSREHPELFQKIQTLLLAEASNASMNKNEAFEDIKQKNRVTALKYLKLREQRDKDAGVPH